MKKNVVASSASPAAANAPSTSSARTTPRARWLELGRIALICAVVTLVFATGVATWFEVVYGVQGPRITGTPTPEPPTATPTSTPTPSPTPTPPPWDRSFALADLPADPQTLVFTEDGTRAAALKDGKITILDTETGKAVETLTEPAPISHCYLMVDQDILVYFYMDPASLKLKVCTYNFGTQMHYVRQSVPFPAGTSVQLVDYCKGMSFVVYQTQTKSGSSTTYDLGWLNTASKIRYTSIHHSMARMLATNLIFHIFSETPGHVLYWGTTQISGLKGKQVQLFGIDAVDNAYAVSLADKQTVYVVKEAAVARTFQLPSPDYQALFTDKVTVYAAYDGYVLDLLATKTNRLDVPTGLTFVYVSGKNLYFTDATDRYYVFSMPFE